MRTTKYVLFRSIYTALRDTGKALVPSDGPPDDYIQMFKLMDINIQAKHLVGCMYELTLVL